MFEPRSLAVPDVAGIPEPGGCDKHILQPLILYMMTPERAGIGQ
jgi:hypothetical protein